MHPTRALAPLLAIASLLSTPLAHAAIGIQSIPDQTIPSGKTLVIPIPATDPSGPARTYTVSIGAPTAGGSATRVAGITAAIRTGDPHLTLGVSYTDSNSVLRTGTMEFQLLREFAPLTTQIIAGLAQGGFYSPRTGGSNGITNITNITFHRVLAGFMIQGGDPNGDGSGGPGFTFENEFSNALIFSGTAGQLAMANSGTHTNGASNGSQFFVTLCSPRSLDYAYNLFGQLLRGYDTLFGIAGTPVQSNGALPPATPEISSPISPVDITSASVSQNDTDAVLLLSATGVCDAPVTITAITASISGSGSAPASITGTFTAHAVADSTNDAPFLRPVPDLTAPNGNLKLALQATDLQLDLLSYGYQRLFPIEDGSVTAGSSPLLSIPLTSCTANTIAASVDHWNRSIRGCDFRIFHSAAGEKALSGSLTPFPSGHYGSLFLYPYPVAVFTAGNPTDSSFTASVNWGDGTCLSGSSLTIVRDTSARTLNRFKLFASHLYEIGGQYPLTVKIADAGGADLTLTGTVNIGHWAIAIAGSDFYHTGGALKNQLLATFDDVGSYASASAYSATIDWGDGTVSPGTVKSTSASTYQILGSHTYKTPDNFTVSATVTRTGYSGYSASEWSTAHIAGIKAPQEFPPFPQAHLAQVWSLISTNSNTVGSSYQIALRTTVTIVNSGNRTSAPGSFSVYADPTGTLDGQQRALTSNGQTSFAIPALPPGHDVAFSFNTYNSTTDTRLKLPIGTYPSGQHLIGVVTYTDPVADFDASEKILSLGQF